MASDSALVRWIMCVSDGTGRPSLDRPTALEWRNRTASIYAYKTHTCYFEVTAEKKYIQCITLPTVLNYWARYIKIAHIESKFWVTPIIESSYWTCTILNIIYFNKSLQQLIIKCLACLYAWSLWIHLLKPSCVFKKINNNIIIIVAAPVIGMYHRRWYHQNVE